MTPWYDIFKLVANPNVMIIVAVVAFVVLVWAGTRGGKK